MLTVSNLGSFLREKSPTEVALYERIEDNMRVRSLKEKRASGIELTAEEERYVVEQEEKQRGIFPPFSAGNDEFKSSMFFPGDGLFHVYKHDRFGYGGFHRHDFIEMLYVYSGHISQTINSETIEMTEGDICIIDMNTRHRINDCAMEGDIAINLLMRPEFFTYQFYESIGEDDQITGFLRQALDAKRGSSCYLHFRTKRYPRVKECMENIICEYINAETGSTEAVKSLITLLFINLMRVYRADMGRVVKSIDSGADIYEILNYIKNNCASCTLETAAASFGYSPTYFGSLIKRTFGKGFTDVRLDFRLIGAANKLKYSDISVADIVRSVGYSNQSYFYRIFRDRYGMTPQEYRDTR